LLGAYVRCGSRLCGNAKGLDRNRTSYSFEPALGTRTGSRFNFKIEPKNIILVARRAFLVFTRPGSFSDLGSVPSDVRFTPANRRSRTPTSSPESAKSRRFLTGPRDHKCPHAPPRRVGFLASSKSSVPKPSVNQPQVGARRSRLRRCCLARSRGARRARWLRCSTRVFKLV